MPHIDLELKPDDDRVVVLKVKTNYGQIYDVCLEFCVHEFGLSEDDVRVHVTKLLNSEEGKGIRAAKSPNAILHLEKPIDQKKPGHSIAPDVWYEFHKRGDYPAVLS